MILFFVFITVFGVTNELLSGLLASWPTFPRELVSLVGGFIAAYFVTGGAAWIMLRLLGLDRYD